MKITPTFLLSSAAQVIITIGLGSFMIVTMAIMGFYAYDAYSNYQKKESIGVIETGRIHSFESMEFTTNPKGVMRNCIALTTNKGKMVVKELGDWEGNIPNGDFCKNLFNHNNLTNWKSMAPTSNGSGFFENTFWSILFFVVFMTGGYLVASIPANIVGLCAPFLASYVKLIALVLTFPVVLFLTLFISSAWQYNPSYWKSHDGYTVKTEKVFISNDNRVFSAPETLFDWSSTNKMYEKQGFRSILSE